MDDDDVHLTLPRTEALALAAIADTGLKVTEALGLIKNTTAAEAGLNQLREAIMAAPPQFPGRVRR